MEEKVLSAYLFQFFILIFDSLPLTLSHRTAKVNIEPCKQDE